MSQSKSKATLPHFEEEQALWTSGKQFVFGIDEAGRGCLAGPVCVGALMLSPEKAPEFDLPLGIKDSKLINEKDRESMYDQIEASSLIFGVGFASSKEVDRWNVLRATYLATLRAVDKALKKLFQAQGTIALDKLAFLTDGSHPLLSNGAGFLREAYYLKELSGLRELFAHPICEKPIIKGDTKILSIASASITAKVSRDRYMRKADQEFPAYAFAVHKGYSTPTHIENLKKAGPCSEHRYSYSPVAEAARLWSV